MAADESAVGDDARYVASDPSEMSRVRWLRSIHDRRQQVVETQRAVDNALLEGVISEDMGHAALRRAVEMLILELDPLLDDEEMLEKADVDVDYWNRAEIGAVDLPNGEAWEFVGLRSIIEEPELREVEWSETVETKENGVETARRSRRVVVPREISVTAYRLANRFVTDIGLGLELEPDETAQYGFRGEVVK